MRTAAVALLLALPACTGGGRTGTPSLRVADAALAGGMPQTALQVTRGVLEGDPRNVPALMKQAEALSAMGQSDTAAECYDRVLAVQPNQAEALRGLGRLRRLELAFLLHGLASRPDFVAYRVRDLTAVAPRAARHMFGLPLLTWTVRSDADRAIAARFADQIIFEGFRP